MWRAGRHSSSAHCIHPLLRLRVRFTPNSVRRRSNVMINKSLVFGLCLIFIAVAMQARELAQDAAQPMQPALFAPGVISTADMELNAAFTPDGRTLYFTKRTPKAQFWTILVSSLKGSRWSTPRVAEFSGQYADFDPFVSPDGSQLFFNSNRPAPGKTKNDFDIWVV